MKLSRRGLWFAAISLVPFVLITIAYSTCAVAGPELFSWLTPKGDGTSKLPLITVPIVCDELVFFYSTPLFFPWAGVLALITQSFLPLFASLVLQTLVAYKVGVFIENRSKKKKAASRK